MHVEVVAAFLAHNLAQLDLPLLNLVRLHGSYAGLVTFFILEPLDIAWDEGEPHEADLCNRHVTVT